MKSFGFLLLLALVTLSCQPSPEEKLARKWTFSLTESALGSVALSGRDPGVRYGDTPPDAHYDYFFRFYPDHTYTGGSNSSPFQHGSWTLRGDTLTVQPRRGGKTLRLTLVELTGEKIALRFSDAKNGAGTLQQRPNSPPLLLVGAADAYDFSEETDYYGLRLNAWRLRATHAESEHELRERLLNHLDYLIAYLGVTLDRVGGEVDLSSVNSPITLAANGIGLKFFENTPDWANTFFDAEEARIAHRMLDEAINGYNRTFRGQRAGVGQRINGEYRAPIDRGLAFYKAYLEGLRKTLDRSAPMT